MWLDEAWKHRTKELEKFTLKQYKNNFRGYVRITSENYDPNFVNKLNQINSNLSRYKIRSTFWKHQYKKLQKFIKKHGRYPNKNETKLYSWVRQQHRVKNKSATGNLTLEQIKLLEKLSNWAWKKDWDKVWIKHYTKVKMFVTRYKEYPTRRKNFYLASWIRSQRAAKVGKGTCVVTLERAKLLEKLPNWEWERDWEGAWQKLYNELQEFIIKHKRYPKKTCTEQRLYSWVRRQRQAKCGSCKSTISTKQRTCLELLPNWKWEGKI